jgi:hypothetical protein
MRAIKWKVPFKTVYDREMVIDIYEDGHDGDPIELTPSESPFETTEENGDDLMAPVRTQSGYIRVMNNGELDESIIPTSGMQHYVEAALDGKVVWSGYMKPDMYDCDWDNPPVEVELPVISGIAYLEGVPMDQTKEMNMMRLGELVMEAVEATGVAYKHIVIPAEVAADEDSAPIAPLLQEISRALFFSRTTENSEDEDYLPYEAKTYMEALEAFCTFWGWTLMERGEDIIFVSPDAGSYLQYDTEDFVYPYEKYKEVSAEAVELNALHMDGTDNRQSVMQGVRKVIITAKIGKIDMAYEYPSTDSMKYYGEKKVASMREGTDAGRYPITYEVLQLYDGTSRTGQTELIQYTKDWERVDFDPDKIYERNGATFAEHDDYKNTELDERGADKKRNYSYSQGVIVNINEVPGDAKYPILVIRRNETFRMKGGYLVISSKAKGIKNPQEGKWEENNAGGTLTAMLRVGSQYRNAKGWVNYETTFDINVGSDYSTKLVKDTEGGILDEKELTDKCNGAEGCIIGMTGSRTGGALKGDMEFTLYCPDGENYRRLYLDNFKIEYYENDEYSRNNTDDDENRYTSVLGNGFSDEKEVELLFASDNNNKEGYGVIGIGNDNTTELYFRGITETVRPEIALLGKLKRLYGRTTKKLTLQVVHGDVSPTSRVIYDGTNYEVTAESVDWENEREELTLMEN